jgi:hypothetical protein
MHERRDEPASEALSTIALLLNVSAVPAFAVGLTGFGAGTGGLATATMAIAAAAFAVSLVCFAVGGYRLDARRAAQVKSITRAR